MKVSIIIPAFNEEKSIKECLVTLLNQKYPDYEIIVVDDGSTDRTKLVVQSLKSKLIHFHEQNHEGAGAARNLGAKYAKGEILVFVDADMTFEKVFIKKLVAPIISKKANGTFSKDEFVSNWSNIWSRCWNWNFNLPSRRRLPKNYPDRQKVFRAILKSKFHKVGGFTPGGYTDDWSLSEKLHEMAVNAEGARFYHRNPDSLGEVFTQARWAAKRPYKFGILGAAVALVRVSVVGSLFWGIVKSVLHTDPRFLIFKFVFNTGQTVGIINYYVTKKGTK